MHKTIAIFLSFSFILISASIDLSSLFDYDGQTIPNYIPNNIDNTPNNNNLTDIGATLGRVLFYDKNLSLNGTVSCASCHQQQFAFSDTATVSVGFDGATTGRHSMRLVNARYGREVNFFWDARAATLEDQTSQPIQDFGEMGFSGTNGQPDLDSLIRRMNDITYYPTLFQNAFNTNEITEERIQFALAQFIRSIVSFDSRYDEALAAAGGDEDADFALFTAAEEAGKDLFMNNQNAGGAGCDRCHRAPAFDMDDDRNNNGVITVAGNPSATDLTNTRSPSLRDLINPDGTLNGPMMHDGSFTSIRQMIDHYDNPPFNNSLDGRLRQGGNNGNQSQNLNLTETEKNNLEAFLLTLTGSNIYTDEKWSDPFDDHGRLFLLDGNCQDDNVSLVGDVSGGQSLTIVSDSISANCSITGDASVLYQAGNSITLEAGFEVATGNILTAQIDGCN